MHAASSHVDSYTEANVTMSFYHASEYKPPNMVNSPNLVTAMTGTTTKTTTIVTMDDKQHTHTDTQIHNQKFIKPNAQKNERRIRKRK